MSRLFICELVTMFICELVRLCSGMDVWSRTCDLSVSVLTQMYCNGCSVVLAYCVSHVLVKVSLLIGPDHCCLMLIIFLCTCVVVYSCVCPGQSPGSRPISAIFPPIFVHFRDPVYPDPAPVPSHFGPAPVSGQKIWQRKWERSFPARSHPHVPFYQKLQK